jgi:hypothetical protein
MTTKLRVLNEPAKTAKNREKPQSYHLAEVERTVKNRQEES